MQQKYFNGLQSVIKPNISTAEPWHMAKSVKLKETDTYIATEGIYDFKQEKTQDVIIDELIQKHEFHSSEKTLVGTYDGKPLYRQTMIFSTNDAPISLSGIVKNLDSIIEVRYTLRIDGANSVVPAPYYYDTTNFCLPVIREALSLTVNTGTNHGKGKLSLTLYFIE